MNQSCSILIACGLLSSLFSLSASAAPFSFTSIGQTYTQDFNNFDGTEASLPSGWSSEGGGTGIFRGIFNSGTNSADDFTGVMAATNGSTGNSIVWRESTGAASLDDFRLIFSFTNNTGTAITSFNFQYTLETWVNGRRDNEMRFKYDTSIDGAFDSDILARNSQFTQNPNHTPIAANGDQFVLDGSLPENRTLVVGTLDLNTYLIDESDPGAGTFGALMPGETGYFRWQISNNELTAGNRSALGINDLSITAIPEPRVYAALFGLLAFVWVLCRRRQQKPVCG